MSTQPTQKPKFNKGEIVRLKSGGPDMTVEGYVTILNVVNYDRVRCTWFKGKDMQSTDFNADALEVRPKTTARKRLTTEEIYSAEIQDFINRFLMKAFMISIHEQHDPMVIWNELENPKPDPTDLMTILFHLEGEGFVTLFTVDGFGHFAEFKLTSRVRELLTSSEEQKPAPIGFKAAAYSNS